MSKIGPGLSAQTHNEFKSQRRDNSYFVRWLILSVSIAIGFATGAVELLVTHFGQVSTPVEWANVLCFATAVYALLAVVSLLIAAARENTGICFQLVASIWSVFVLADILQVIRP